MARLTKYSEACERPAVDWQDKSVRLGDKDLLAGCNIVIRAILVLDGKALKTG